MLLIPEPNGLQVQPENFVCSRFCADEHTWLVSVITLTQVDGFADFLTVVDAN